MAFRDQQSRILSLEQLPVDVFLIVLRHLNVATISNLARTCRLLYNIIEDTGWRVYSISNPMPHQSLTPALEHSRWSMRDLVRHQKLAQDAWDTRQFVARPLGPEWPSKFHPVIALSSSRLVVAAGNTLFLYKFIPPARKHSETPRITFERVMTFPQDARRDISGVAFDADESGLILSFVHGPLGRIQISPSLEPSRRRKIAVKSPALSYISDHGHPIRSMSTVKNTVLTLDSVGTASIYSLTDPSLPLVSSINVGGTLPVTGWSTHLSLQSSSGYAVLGTSSTTPLTVHAVRESGLVPYPQVILSPSARPLASSYQPGVYSISGATETFPWASPSNQIVLAGWYQGVISLHDLRCPTHHDLEGRGSVLSPALTLQDPLASSPIYSLSSAGSHIAGGSAQHSLMHLYDVRFPKTGWSIYLPRGRSSSSPVYSCLLESTRLWAATESHAFVVDFGQVNERTFPTLHGPRAGTRPAGGIGWHAPFYEHGMFFKAHRSS